MAFSRSEFNRAIGAFFPTARAETLMTFVESAGNPTGTVTPSFVGQECLDTANGRFYRAVGLTPADWRASTT